MTAPLISIYKLHWPDLLRRLDEFVGVLSMDEQERASRFHFDLDRQRFILCRAWLRCILGEHLAMPPHAVAFRLGSHGKPAVDGPWQFNLSHSGIWALCAVARGLPVGVDIEVIRPMPDAADLALEFFSPDEASMIHSGTPEQLEQRFLALWTRKEAFVKALGTGFYTDPGNFTVGLDARFIEDGGGQRWHQEARDCSRLRRCAMCTRCAGLAGDADQHPFLLKRHQRKSNLGRLTRQQSKRSLNRTW